MRTKLALFFYITLLFLATFVEMRMPPKQSRILSNPSLSTNERSYRYLQDVAKNKTTETNTTGHTQHVTMRLRGNSELGYYYVTLFFGSSLQKETLIVNTGGSTTTIPCKGK